MRQTGQDDAVSGARAVIDVQVHDIQQLFNSLDPTPFPDRDLDADAEEFIVGWALEHPSHLPILLRVHLREQPRDAGALAHIGPDIQRYFAYRAQVIQRQLHQLLRVGRTSLAVGLLCLTLAVVGASLIARLGEDAWVSLLRESMVIGGWVAMWRPLQIFLYDWWPIRRHRVLCERLSRAEVRVIGPGG